MDHSNRTAIVIGATGLIGRALVLKLLEEPGISKIKTFSRKGLGISHSKLEEHFIDFDQLDHFSSEITGDLLFSSMGTTLKAAGSKEAQYKVDFTYQYEFARLAAQNNVSQYFLVSAINANADSSFFYPKIKGELEQAVKKLPFDAISIFRPSVLRGQRDNMRYGEEIGRRVIDALQWIPPLKSYRSISGDEMARAMITASTQTIQNPITIYNPNEIWQLLRQ